MSTTPPLLSKESQRNLTPGEVNQHAEELPQELLIEHYQALFSYAERLKETIAEQRDFIESLGTEVTLLQDQLEEAQKPCPNCN